MRYVTQFPCSVCVNYFTILDKDESVRVVFHVEEMCLFIQQKKKDQIRTTMMMSQPGVTVTIIFFQQCEPASVWTCFICNNVILYKHFYRFIVSKSEEPIIKVTIKDTTVHRLWLGFFVPPYEGLAECGEGTTPPLRLDISRTAGSIIWNHWLPGNGMQWHIQGRELLTLSLRVCVCVCECGSIHLLATAFSSHIDHLCVCDSMCVWECPRACVFAIFCIDWIYLLFL